MVFLMLFVELAIQAQEMAFTRLMQGRNQIPGKTFPYNKKIDVRIIPWIEYAVLQDKTEMLKISFQLQWPTNGEPKYSGYERIFLIYDATAFREYCDANPNFKIRKIKDEIANSLKLEPDYLIKFKPEEVFDMISNTSQTILCTIDTSNIKVDMEPTFSMDLICYLGEQKSNAAILIDGKSEKLTWIFKLRMPSESPECEEKYDQYAQRFGKLKEKHQFDVYEEVSARGEQHMVADYKGTKKVLKNVDGLKPALQNLWNDIESDNIKKKCENLEELKLDVKKYLDKVDSEQPLIETMLAKIKHLEDSLINRTKKITEARNEISHSNPAIREQYRDLKFMEWNKVYDSLVIERAKTWLENQNSITRTYYNSLETEGGLDVLTELRKNEFDNYYKASIDIIKKIESLEKNTGVVTQQSEVINPTKKNGRKSFYWLIIPVVAVAGGFFAFRYWKHVKKAQAKKGKIKSG